MFEKEGIKYALEETIGTECLSKPIEDFSFIDLADEQQEKAQCYKDGAEFGYNKGYHDAEEHYLNVIDSQHKLVDESRKKEKEIIRNLIRSLTDEEKHLTIDVRHKWVEKAKKFLE